MLNYCFPQVKTWITIYEPSVISNLGYGTGQHAPGRVNSGINDYIVGHNLLRAHVKTYQMYKSKYAAQSGIISNR